MKNIRFVLPVLLLAAEACFGQFCNDKPMVPSMLPDCPTIADKLYQAFQAAQEFNKAVDQLNAEVDQARSRYWKVYPNGPGAAAAELAFLKALQDKDLYYLLFSLQQGINGDAIKYANAIQVTADPFGFDPRTPKDLSFPTNVDGGIRPYAFPMFASWVNALRRAEGRTKDGEWAQPQIIAEAIKDRSNWRKQYEDARNWAEFLSSGLDVTKYVTPQVYLVNQMESDVSMGLARSKPAELPDPKASSVDLYNLFVKAFGEKEVLAAAASTLQAPKNSVGGLATRAAVSIGGYQTMGSPNPFLLFLTKAVNASARNYAVALCLDQTALLGSGASATFYSKEQWAKAVTTYGQLVTRFGEPAVVAAAARLKDVPKDDRGGPQGDPDSKGPIYWFTALLKDPKTQVPEASRFLASSYDPRWMGKIVAVRGTVSRVDVEKGSPPYATIHFREAKNDRFMAFTPNSELLDSYGQNSSALVGKPIEIWGQVQDWKEGSGVRFLIAKQLTVLDAGALANFKESAPDWMKAPFVSNLVDSPKYLAWKKFPVGAKAVYENDLLREYKPGTDQYTKTVISKVTLTLKSIDDERAVVTGDSTVSQSSSELIFKAKEAPSTPVDDPTRVITHGEETLTINGQKIATKWESNARADDPMTFTKTWTSDEVPGGLVRTQQETHAQITNETYRSISQTLYAPIDGVAPQLGDAASAAPKPAANTVPTVSATPTAPAQPPAPVAPPTPRGRQVPAATVPNDMAELMQHYNATMRRATQARVGLLQAQRKLTVAGAALPDDIRAAQDKLTNQQRTLAASMGTRDSVVIGKNLSDMEDTLGVIEKFLGQVEAPPAHR